MALQEDLMGKLVNRKAKVDLSRPSVDLTPTKRVWKDIQAQYLLEGDIVSGMGVVLVSTITCQGQVYIEAGLPESKEYFLKKQDFVKAFVKKDGVHGS